MQVTNNSNQFGLNITVNFENCTVFFKPAAMHKLAVDIIIGRATKAQLEQAKVAAAEALSISHSEVL